MDRTERNQPQMHIVCFTVCSSSIFCTVGCGVRAWTKGQQSSAFAIERGKLRERQRGRGRDRRKRGDYLLNPPPFTKELTTHYKYVNKHMYSVFTMYIKYYKYAYIYIYIYVGNKINNRTWNRRR